uniref:Integrase catalytic domain-containing protein n=1 Tax=Anopheles atroparvus TaxID=41427 RepID=A0AAG5DPQ0_ANOAO
MLPDNYAMARRRLECLERRMRKDNTLRARVCQQLREFEAKGYIHRATKEELSTAVPGKVCYLPLGTVTSPKKPGKLRIIWDAAAKVNGVSLNSVLLKGPDQLVSLVGVLFRFRLYQYAVSADVKEMFLQILMRPEDRHAQRFLWRTDPRKDPDVYLVNVVTFGSTCSPASAQYVKNRNAQYHAEHHPRAVEGILNGTYVDDYLDSFAGEEETIRISQEVRQVFQDGGFQLRNWVSNSPAVVEHFGTGENPTYKTLMETSKNERVLGMMWNPESDDLAFNTVTSPELTTLYEGDVTPTKRQVLRCVMSLFDPLGLLATFIIHGKILIQDLWRAGTGWDDEIRDIQLVDWRRWIKMFPCIRDLRIPRCYFSRATEQSYASGELHVFVDASPLAYSCVVYLRIVDSQGLPRCTLIAGKAKVAPLKPVTIPKMELQACIMGARMMKFAIEYHPIPIVRRTLWTDSSVALSWIRADPRNYRPYVAHRVAEIQDITTVEEWRWVPTLMNPADEATKWGSGPYFKEESKWFHGPTFLLSPEADWPTTPRALGSPTEEMRATLLLLVEWVPLLKYERFSKWERLLRTMAYVRRFASNIQPGRARKIGPLTQEELMMARVELLRQVQNEAFPDEVAELMTDSPTIEKTSSIHTYCPIMDERGLIRQQSRLATADHLEYDVRFPIILPRQHPCTTLLVEKLHRKYRHAHSETVVNEIRQEYAIPKLRPLVKRIIRNCCYCKVRRTIPAPPRMAALPKARLAIFEPPFSRTGVDYFGPFLIKQGRANVKRWVALFTCLTTRAVHLEVACDLSTASLILCVRRFVCRRGPPKEIYSDNGTNFQGAARILRNEISQGMLETFTDENTRWQFIPPGAPHMGGAWERLVRSVKAAIGDAYTEGKLSHEEFETMLAEAEAIVNSHPLTYLPLDSAESEALTPNHFLLGSSSGRKSWDETPLTRRGASKEAWAGIKLHIARMWQRWLKEYLPELRKQTKWFEETRPLQEGNVVLIADENRRNRWVRGRVTEPITGADGRIRQAYVKTTHGILRRPVTKLVVLDIGP